MCDGVLRHQGPLDGRHLLPKLVAQRWAMRVSKTQILVEKVVGVECSQALDPRAGRRWKRLVGRSHASESRLASLRGRRDREDAGAEGLRMAKGVVRVP